MEADKNMEKKLVADKNSIVYKEKYAARRAMTHDNDCHRLISRTTADRLTRLAVSQQIDSWFVKKERKKGLLLLGVLIYLLIGGTQIN